MTKVHNSYVEYEDAFTKARRLKADPTLTDRERLDALYKEIWGVTPGMDIAIRLAIVGFLITIVIVGFVIIESL